MVNEENKASRLGGLKLNTSIYDYLDYRKFLQDLTKELKVKRSSYNLSNLAKWVGLKSPGYFKMIMDGNRNLTADLMNNFCDLLKFSAKERRYFEALVSYNHETNPDRKNHFFQELTALTPRKDQYQLKKNQHKYLTCDYFPVVRELVTLKGFKEDYEWIASKIVPPIKPDEAKEAIEILLEMHLLKRDETGKLVQTESFVKTEDYHTQIAEAYQAHDSILKRAREALVYLKQEDRNYYALTISLPDEKVAEIVEKFYRLRDEIVDTVNQVPVGESDNVFQVNFQLFKRTDNKEG